MRRFRSVYLLIFFSVIVCQAFITDDGAEKVDVYYSHFLLQSWPQNKRTLNIDIDTSLPPDTLVFKATGLKGGLTQTTLEIQNLSGTSLDKITRVNLTTDGKEATFIYPLTPVNLNKIKGRNFKVVLDNHQYSTPEIHTIALVVITKM